MAALVIRTRGQDRTGSLAFMVVLLVGSAGVLYVGGVALGLLQQLPVFSTNPVARLRVIVGFAAAVLAAFGLDAVLRPYGARADLTALRKPRARTTLALRAAGGLTVVLVVIYAVLSVRRQTPDPVGLGLQLREGFALAACCALLVVLAWALERRWASTVAAVGIFVLVTVPAIGLARAWWPQNDVELYYQRTATHEFLDTRLDGQRYATVGQVMLPGSSTAYAQRSLGGHAFTTPEWRELMLAADPEMMLTPTYSGISPANRDVALDSGAWTGLASATSSTRPPPVSPASRGMPTRRPPASRWPSARR
ncbi:hypothetical protein [Cellulosimicrobium sp. CUA-896]|uniref:hypothetical protein n=1 Tax=Cellulosimicrobium sp. CUA-896 TaxID=1517881 RepID=UPI00111509F0|nr:hypothetical protein [Cellulosimicrobium sp. CUA-896]